jgi:hypothetical protein
MKAVCLYAVLRYQPFVQTGEFANIGVALCCPERRYFGHRLMLRKYGRVTQFFEGLDANAYLGAIHSADEQLNEFRSVLKSGPLDGRRRLDAALARQLFSELVKPRESVLRFDTPVTTLADDPEAAMREAFDFYVGRNFVTKEFREQVLVRAVRGLLNGAKLAQFYAQMPVGDDTFHVNVPFVYAPNDRAEIAIKPMSLSQPETSRILDHGGHWVDRIKRLRRLHQLPRNFLFAVDIPAQPTNEKYSVALIENHIDKRIRAANEIADELTQAGAQVVSVRDKSEILRVAEVARMRPH